MDPELLASLLLVVCGAGVWSVMRRPERIVLRSERPIDLTPVYHLIRRGSRPRGSGRG